MKFSSISFLQKIAVFLLLFFCPFFLCSIYAENNLLLSSKANLSYWNEPSNYTEETQCMQILSDAIKNTDDRDLKGVDLTSVNVPNKSGIYDLSKYFDKENKHGFIGARSSRYAENYFFRARRNNIGTILTNRNYIKSQIVPFGQNTNFEYPLQHRRVK